MDTAARKTPAVAPVKQLATGWLTMFVVGSDLFVVSPLLPLIAADYGISPELAGLSVTLFSITYALSAPLLGHAADRIGRRRLLICSLCAFGAANLLTAAAANLICLLAARAFAGAMAAGVSPSVYALVGGGAPLNRRATWLAIIVTGLLVSLSLGAPIGVLAARFFGWPGVFVGLAGPSLLLALANSRVWPDDQGRRTCAAQVRRLPAADFAPRLAPTVVWSTAVYAMYTYLGAGLTSSGFSIEEIAEVILCYGWGAICGALAGGRMADWLGAKLTSTIGLAGLSFCFLLLRLALHAGVLVEWTFGLLSAVAQLFFPAQQAGLAADFPTRRATVLAWNNSALFFGITCGSLIGGQALRVGGFDADLTIAAAIAIVAWAMNSAVQPSRPNRHSPAADQPV